MDEHYGVLKQYGLWCPTRVYILGERSMSVCVCGGGGDKAGGGWRRGVGGGNLALACRNKRVKSCPLFR